MSEPTYEQFPTLRALRPEDGPLMFVRERAQVECGCAVYVGTLAGTGGASVAAFPCSRHEEAIATFRGYLAEALGPNPHPPQGITKLAGELLRATLWEHDNR